MKNLKVSNLLMKGNEKSEISMTNFSKKKYLIQIKN